jgi:hypothetical protein
VKIEPNAELLSDKTIPTIELAGKRWPIPFLAPKQNRIVVPALLRVTPKILRGAPHVAGVPTEAKAKANTSRLADDLERLAEGLTKEGFDDLLDACFWAIQRGHPEVDRMDFEDWPIGVLDMIAASLIIARQTGVIKTTKVGEAGAAKPGEATAGTSRTGTQ